MNNPDIRLDPREWSEVSLSLDDVARAKWLGRTARKSAPSFLQRLLPQFFGEPAHDHPVDNRLHALHQYIAAATARKSSLDEWIPDLLAFGYNCRQIKALALLSAPPRDQPGRAH